jgi:hypothetical protein
MLTLDRDLKSNLPSLKQNPLSKYILSSDIVGAASKIVTQEDRDYIFDNLKLSNRKLYELGLRYPGREDLALIVAKLGAKWAYFFRLGAKLSIESLKQSNIVKHYLRIAEIPIYLFIELFLERAEEELDPKAYWDKKWGPNPGPIHYRNLSLSKDTFEFLLQHHDKAPFKNRMKYLLTTLQEKSPGALTRYMKYYNYEIVKIYLPSITPVPPQSIADGSYKLEHKGNNLWFYDGITILELNKYGLLIGGQIIATNEDKTYSILADITLYRFIMKPGAIVDLDLVNDTMIIR